MIDETASRRWATPVHASITKRRHKFGVDGRLLFCPIAFPTIPAILFAYGHPLTQMVYAGIGFGFWALASIAWAINPYLLDDVAAEFASPTHLSDVPRRDER
ncbi:MAG: hypothetical protein NVS1B2_26960 [Vulcanimicrobiaceae bacterium]